MQAYDVHHCETGIQMVLNFPGELIQSPWQAAVLSYRFVHTAIVGMDSTQMHWHAYAPCDMCYRRVYG